MNRIERILITLIFLVISIILYNLFYGTEVSSTNSKEISFVTNIVDGDTIVVSGGDRVRLLGIDTPEKGEVYYNEAKNRLESLIENKEVLLEKEGDNKDQYGRLLRYVFLNETNVNMILVKEGYAACYFYEESKYKQECAEIEMNAIQNKIGRWKLP